MKLIKTYWVSIAAILLLVIMAVTLLFNAKNDSQTVDEGVYISAGYAQYEFRGNNLNYEHPPLAKYLIGLPVVALRPTVSSKTADLLNDADQYSFAESFLYRSQNNAEQLIFYGRLPIIIITLILGVVLFFFGVHLFKSQLAGLITLFFYCLSPNIIAHGHLATTDLVLTCFFCLTVFATYLYFEKPTASKLLAITLFLSGAVLTKFSALVLVPILGLIFILKIALNRKQFKRYLIDFGLIILGLFLLIWLIYWLWGHDLHFLIKGIGYQLSNSAGGRTSYLWGNYSRTGWWYYFPIAYLIKTPITTTILFVLAITLWIKDKALNYQKYLVLIIPPVVLFLLSLTSSINLGLRYILPIYPFIFLTIGSLAISPYLRQLWLKILFIILSLWYLIAFLLITPYQLTYFNEIVGGPANGAEYLIDSNIDWGQDLARLAEYLQAENIESISLSYFGTADPNYYGINYRLLPDDSNLENTSGYVVVSIHNLKLIDSLAWLKQFEPVAKIGNSLYIYNILTGE